jgi:hypothetical protein
MSGDPDDNTPGTIRQSGASIITYGVPVLPCSMFLMGYFPDGIAIVGIPCGAMYRGEVFSTLCFPESPLVYL